MPRCAQCKTPTTRRIGLTHLCDIECAVQYGQAKRDKLQRIEQRKAEQRSRSDLRKAKVAIRPIKWYADKAREACHEYVRFRDANEPCISCQRFHVGKWNAGHFRPSGVNAALRYDERNIHKQCEPCNSHLSGNLIEYRRNLIHKIGEAAVLELESNNEVYRWGQDELVNIRKHYQRKLKELRSSIENADS